MKRSPEQVVWDFVQGWLRKARSDLRSAELLLESDFDDYATAAFHAQQGAEKMLKALLVRQQIAFPKTHDIGDLLGLVRQVDAQLADDMSGVETLTPFAVEARYPEVEVSFEQAETAVDGGRMVERAVTSCLQDYLKAGRPESPSA